MQTSLDELAGAVVLEDQSPGVPERPFCFRFLRRRAEADREMGGASVAGGAQPYPDPPPPGMAPSCQEAGVLGVLPGIVGSLQAVEAIKLIVGTGKTLSGRLLVYDALGTKFRTLELRKDPYCRVCSKQPEEIELIDYEASCSIGA